MADTMQLDDIKTALKAMRQIMEQQRDRLTDLDNELGDGDLGLTMTKGFAVADELAASSDENEPGRLLMKVGMQLAKTVPSTMGTLLATGFMRGGKAVGATTEIGCADMALFLRAFVDGIMERGKTQPGNKTIVDSLDPAAAAMQQAAQADQPLGKGLEQALAAAQDGAEAAIAMKAQHGRAAYYQDESIGKEDGGAVVGVLIMEGFARDWGQARFGV